MHLDPALRFIEPGPLPSTLLKFKPKQLSTKDSLLAQMQRATSRWRRAKTP
jgi:hypothetical protein